MKVTISAKLKLNHTPEQKSALDQVSLAFRDALNHTSQVAFLEGKISNTRRLQKLVYPDLRSRFKLPFQMACNVPRSVAATYKGLWTKAKQHQIRKEAGHTKRPYKGLDNPPKYVSRTIFYNYGRDFSFKLGQRVSILTLEGRMIMPFEGYAKHLEYLKNGAVLDKAAPHGGLSATIGGAKLWYDKAKKQYYLLVSLELDCPDPDPLSDTEQNVVGIDVGQRFHAVGTDFSNHTVFFSGKETNERKDRYQKVTKSLRRKGTRSAIKRLVQLSGREGRFVADRNHVLVKAAPHGGLTAN